MVAGGMGEEDPERFDITLSDVTAAELAVVLGGVGRVGAEAATTGQLLLLQRSSAVSKAIMLENPEATRHLALSDDVPEELRFVGDLSGDILDELGLDVDADGRPIPAMDEDDATEIEVE